MKAFSHEVQLLAFSKRPPPATMQHPRFFKPRTDRIVHCARFFKRRRRRTTAGRTAASRHARTAPRHPSRAPRYASEIALTQEV